MRKPPYLGVIYGPVIETNANTGQTTLYPGEARTESGSISSVRTPGFRNLAKSNIPWNNFSYWYDYVNYHSGRAGSYLSYMGYTWSGYEGFCFGRISGSDYQTFLSIRDHDDQARSDALSKLLDKLKDQSVNLAQAFAEREQTVKMIGTTINRIASAVRAIRGGNMAHAGSLLGFTPVKFSRTLSEIPPSPKNLANHWLEYSYGWKPLLADIHGSCELLAKSFEENKPHSVKVKVERRTVLPEVTSFYSSSGPYANIEKMLGQRTTTARYVVDYVIDNAIAHQLATTGITNPAALAWELLPYSFVVDWFIPVGNYLSSLDAVRGLSFSRGSLSLHTKSIASTRWDSTAQGDFSRITGLGRDFDSERINRTILYEFPRPELPAFNPKIGVERALSGISLLTQAFKR